MQPPPSPDRAAPRSGSSPRSSPLLHPPIKQPRAAAAPPEAASSVPQLSSPAQRELPQKEPTPSLNRAAPRSGSSPRSSLFRPSIKQPRAAGAPPERAYSVPQSGSPAQRQLPQKQPPTPSPNQAAPRSGSSPRSSLLRPSIKQPRAAGASPERASPVPQSSSPYSVPQSTSCSRRLVNTVLGPVPLTLTAVGTPMPEMILPSISTKACFDES